MMWHHSIAHELFARFLFARCRVRGVVRFGFFLIFYFLTQQLLLDIRRSIRVNPGRPNRYDVIRDCKLKDKRNTHVNLGRPIGRSAPTPSDLYFCLFLWVYMKFVADSFLLTIFATLFY
jgi:hypothetical protein